MTQLASGKEVVMISTMRRPRVFFDAEADLKLALKLRAVREGKSVSAIIEAFLKEYLSAELAEARKTLKQREKAD